MKTNLGGKMLNQFSSFCPALRMESRLMKENGMGAKSVKSVYGHYVIRFDH